MAASFTSVFLAGASSSLRASSAGPGVASAAAFALMTAAYPWYSVPRNAGEIELQVDTRELEVFFEERIR